MSRKIRIGLGLVMLLVFNALLLPKESLCDDPRAASRRSIRAAETREYIATFKRASVYRHKHGLSGIGNLVKGFWIGELPLDEDQAEVIVNLDDVISGARAYSFRAGVDYLDGNPADYQDYVARSNARRGETIDHAQLMVTLGLLTEPQATFVTGRYLAGRWEELLWDRSIQVWFGITESQKEALRQVAEKARRRAAPLPKLPTEPEARERIKAHYADIRKVSCADAMAILTPEQREKWDQLTTERTLPAEPPDVPALSEAEAARIKIEELSPTFRVLAEKADALGLSAEQKRLLKDLRQVTQVGLFWISQREPADPNAKTHDDFLKHAEQVALVGILSWQQSEQVRVLLEGRL